MFFPPRGISLTMQHISQREALVPALEKMSLDLQHHRLKTLCLACILNSEKTTQQNVSLSVALSGYGHVFFWGIIR